MAEAAPRRWAGGNPARALSPVARHLGDTHSRPRFSRRSGKTLPAAGRCRGAGPTIRCWRPCAQRFQHRGGCSCEGSVSSRSSCAACWSNRSPPGDQRPAAPQRISSMSGFLVGAERASADPHPGQAGQPWRCASGYSCLDRPPPTLSARPGAAGHGLGRAQRRAGDRQPPAPTPIPPPWCSMHRGSPRPRATEWCLSTRSGRAADQGTT